MAANSSAQSSAQSNGQPSEQQCFKPQPQQLLHWRRVTYPIDDMKNHANLFSVPGKKYYQSLDYQMTFSLQELTQKLAQEGKQYELSIKRQKRAKPIGSDRYGKRCCACCDAGQNQTHWTDRWKVYANGCEIVELDADYGYDCFDISSTCFMDNMERVLMESGIQPLSDDEVRALELVRKMIKIIEVG